MYKIRMSGNAYIIYIYIYTHTSIITLFEIHGNDFDNKVRVCSNLNRFDSHSNPPNGGGEKPNLT